MKQSLMMIETRFKRI